MLIGDGIVDLELINKEDKKVIVPTEEPPFQVLEQGMYNAEFVYWSLCGMDKLFKLWIGRKKDGEEYKPLVLASELTEYDNLFLDDLHIGYLEAPVIPECLI